MTSIVVRTRFEGIHRWQSAPDEVAFLRDFHRHEFHVELEMEVHHEDRELEFILVKRALDRFIDESGLKDPSPRSCETIAKRIISWAKQTYGLGRNISCGVFEDGENGARVE